MANGIRLLLAVLLFCLGGYLVWDLFAAGFSLVVVVFSLLCFILAHYIKPKPNDRGDSSLVWDVSDFIVDIPFRAISLFIRCIGKPLKGDIDCLDLWGHGCD